MTNYVNSIQSFSISIASATTFNTAVLSYTDTPMLQYDGCYTTATTSRAQGEADLTISKVSGVATITATRKTSSTNVTTVTGSMIDVDSTNFVQSVQHFTVTPTVEGTTNTTLGTTIGTLAHAHAHLLGTQPGNATFSYGTNTPTISLSSTTNLATILNTLTTSLSFAVMVVEYKSGALNSSIQQVLVSWTSSTTSTNTTITSVGVNNTLIWYNGFDILNNETYAGDNMVGQLTTATNLQVSCGVAVGDTSLTYGTAIVEYATGVMAQSVQRGTIAVTNAGSNTATLGTALATGVAGVNFAGWKSTSTATTSLANTALSLALTSATVVNAQAGGTVPSGQTSTPSYEAYAMTNSSGFTGTGAITEGGDTASGAGKFAYAGTAATTEGADTAAGVGRFAGTGSGSVTEGADTASGSGYVPGVGLIFPAYIYPPDPAFSTLISLMGSYPTVPVITILNPDSGPGVSTDPNYTTVISQLNTAGAVPIGYVNTQYATIASATVEAQVALWQSLYPGIKGIFFDNMDNTAPNVSYYVTLNAYVKSLGMIMVVGNPGTATIAAYYSNATADIMVIQEVDGSYPTQAQASNSGIGTAQQRAVIGTSVPWNQSSFSILANNCKYVWATNGNNNYGDIPGYLALAFLSLSDFNANALQQGVTIENADIGSSTGKITPGGIGAVTETADTAVGSGKETFTGSGAPAEGADVAAGSGATAGVTTTGSGASVESPDTASGSGAETFTGAGTPTEGADIGNGSGGISITGSGSPVEGADTAAGVALITFTGSGAVTEALDTASGAGLMILKGSGSVTESADVASGNGGINITGAGSSIEGGDVANGSGGFPFIGSGNAMEGADVANASGFILITGMAGIIEGFDVANGQGKFATAGMGSPSEGVDTATGIGVVILTGAGSATEGADVAIGLGSFVQVISGSGAAHEGADVATGFGKAFFKSPKKRTFWVDRESRDFCGKC